jgi:hypothetical protein
MEPATLWGARVVWTGNPVEIGQVFGEVVKFGTRGDIFIREVKPEGNEVIFRCQGGGSSMGSVRRLSLLEILAVVSQPFYFDNPKLRLCENDDCPKVIDPMKGLYCSRNCALGDA